MIFALEKSKIRLKIDYMNKISFLFIVLLMAGCSKDYNNVVDVPVTNFQVSAVGTVNTFNYTPSDSILTLNIKFSSIEGVKSVFCDINTPDDKPLNNGHIELLDNGENSANGDSVSGDNIFSNKFTMSSSFSHGNYDINYYITLNDGSEKLVAQQIIKYDNGQSNIAPVISNLVMPDTVQFDQSFTFSVQAIDSNGAGDISQVYYELYKPDGTKISNSQGISKFPLSDSGDTITSGDITANDGVYTNKLTFPSGQPAGDWVFKFHAIDTGAKISNEISKTVTVK